MTSSTAVAPASPRSLASVATLFEPRQTLSLSGITWSQYVQITDALPDRDGLRTCFDGETLELMTTSRRHVKWKELLGRLLEYLTVDVNLPLESCGQRTLRDQFIERGLEPDRCY